MITPAFALTATERVLPRLALDFTTASLDSRVTFTRALNTATVTNSSGYVVGINADLPRFDYDPVTLACKGLLIEESRINLILQSNDINDAAWTKSDATVGNNAIVSPDGTQNADKLVEAATTALHFVRQNVVGVVGTTYASSIYLKAGERTQAVFIVYDGTTFNGASINLTTGAVTAPPVDAGVTDISASVTATAVGNNWFYVKNAIIQAVGTTRQIRIATQNGANSVYAGDITKGIYVWGGQIEAGAFATSYIPTTTLAVTRNADVATMTGTNFSSWFNATQGTFVCTADRTYTGNFAAYIYPFNANDNTANNEITAYGIPSGTQFAIGMTVGGVGQLDYSADSWNVEPSKFAVAYQQNNTQFGINASAKTTDTTCNIPTVTQLAIGRRTTSGYWTGHIQKLNYYPQRLISAELAAFTK